MNNINKVVRAKLNEKCTKPDEDSYLPNSTFGKLEIMVKEGNEDNGELMQIQDGKIKYNEELEIKEEPIDFTEDFFQNSQCNQASPHNYTTIKPQRVYTGNKPYHCSYCDKVFSTNSSLIYHKKLHTGEQAYQCSQCDKAFSTKSNFLIHQRIHSGEKPYQCNICDKGFAQKSNLMHHMKVHSGEKPYQCNICDKGFAQKSKSNRV
ncbi:unnamed protein product [Meganyctiphanes norvegica]|uniref:C2H2-type domain-containing protein n=1 Tax=Meganyctiphanes norvegica TaxID=48144 RepID=A0AAV2RTV8_MEGNR